MPSMLNRAAGQVFVVVLGVLIASGGMTSAQRADDPASGDGLRTGGFAQPNVGDRHILWPFGSSGPPIRVYGAAQNERSGDPSEHVYLYEPPLRFRVADDGTIDVRSNDFDPRKVIFYLEGLNQDLEKHIEKELLDEKMIEVRPGNVRALQYTSITLSDDSRQWESRYPEGNESRPAPQSWIPFEVDFTGYEDGEERANKFVDRLRDPKREVEFNVTLGYEGRGIVRNTIRMTTRRLLETSFHADLTGDGRFAYVSRNQIRNALAAARTEIQQTVYLEDPDATVPDLEWPERTWDRTTVAWDDFKNRHLAEASRYGFDGNDLTPDRFTRFEEHLKTEMEDETKDYIDIQANMKAEASLLGIVDMGSEYGGQVKKEEFERRRRVNENGVEWEGEVFRPRSIDLFVMDREALENEDRIGSDVITARPRTERFSFTISSRQGRPGRVAYVPSGAIVAFDREDGCPPGWSEYRDADGRFIVGTGRHDNEVADLEFGEVGGERTHRLSVNEMPSHAHRQWYANGERSGGHGPEIDLKSAEEDLRGVQFPTDSAGGNTPHNNMPPYLALRFCRLN